MSARSMLQARPAIHQMFAVRHLSRRGFAGCSHKADHAGSIAGSVAGERYTSMATVATQSLGTHPFPRITPITEQPLRKPVQGMDFDPKKHLVRVVPTKPLLMKDLGYRNDTSVSPVAVSEPFQLFTPEAIQVMRAEIFKPEVQRNCVFSSNIAACQIRGYAKEYAPFTYNAWTHPETLAIISQIAKVELVPVMDYEIGHINISVKTEAQTTAEQTLGKDRNRMDGKRDSLDAEDEGLVAWRLSKDTPVVGWHTDSYPFVCILMMSDCTNMVGGETSILTGTGDVLKVRGPTQGCAVIMQGRHILHQAERAFGVQERITSVTSFRPKSALLSDDSVLRTVRPVSNLSGLYLGFAEYRLEIMEERIRQQRRALAACRKAGEKFDTPDHKLFLKESVAFMQHTDDELVEEENVRTGHIDEVNQPDAVVSVDDRLT